MEHQCCNDCGKYYSVSEDGPDEFIDGLGTVGPCCVAMYQSDDDDMGCL